jgi:hypothetical protein
MADDAEAQEIHATITSVGPREEPTDDDQMEPDVVGAYEDDDEDEDDDTEDHDTSPDAVIVGSATPVLVTDDADDDLDDLSDETSAEESPLDARADDDTHPDTVQAEAVPVEVTAVDVTAVDVTDGDDVTDADDVPEDAADADAADSVPEDATLADVTAADATPEDADAVPVDAVPVDAVGPASADAFPRHARPADAIPETARPGMPSDTAVVTSEGDLAGDPQQLHERWAAIQSTFVDDPRGSVEAAAELVTETINALTAAAKERETGLRSEWDHEGVDTEVLRNTLRNYRGLLDRLVAV